MLSEAECLLQLVMKLIQKLTVMGSPEICLFLSHMIRFCEKNTALHHMCGIAAKYVKLESNNEET